MEPVCAEGPYLPSPIPPPMKRPFLKVLRPKPNQEVGGICINQELIAVYTHWQPGVEGKVRCIYTGESCEGEPCPDTERRWYGYMPVLWGNGRVSLLEVSHAAALNCEQLTLHRRPTRGMYLKIGRHAGGKSARCFAVLEKYHREVKGLPPALDPAQVLDMIFAHCESGIPCGAKRKKGGNA